MGFFTWLLIILGALVLGFLLLRVGLQFMFHRAIAKKRGQPLPTLKGPAGKTMAGRSSGMLYFFSPGCVACKNMTPVMREMSKKDPSTVLVDISQDMETARTLGIMGTPSLVLVREGLIADIRVGPMPLDQIEQLYAV